MFATQPVLVALRKMIVPAAVSQIIVLIYNMADTFYIGRTGDPYMLAGASLILPVFNMLMCLSSLAGVGGGTLISRLLGAGEEAEARKVSVFSFYLGLALSVLYSAGLGLLMEPALRFLGAGDTIIVYARQYAFCVIVLGGIPTVLSNVLSNLVRSVGLSKEAGFGITLGAVLNIILDPVFMYLVLPDGQQVLGVGIATFVSNCISFLYFLGVLWKIRGTTAVTIHPAAGLPGPRSIGQVFWVGIPSAVTSFLFDLDYMVIDKLMVTYSEEALAAIGIVLKVERLPLNVGIGICQGMVPLVAYNCAAGNQKRMDQVVRLSLLTGLVVGAGSILLYEAFAPWIIRVFISDAQTVGLATSFIRIRILGTPLMFLSFFTVYLFQGFGKGGISLVLAIVQWAVFNIPMICLLNYLVGMYGIIWSPIVGDTFTVLVLRLPHPKDGAGGLTAFRGDQFLRAAARQKSFPPNFPLLDKIWRRTAQGLSSPHTPCAKFSCMCPSRTRMSSGWDSFNQKAGASRWEAPAFFWFCFAFLSPADRHTSQYSDRGCRR